MLDKKSPEVFTFSARVLGTDLECEASDCLILHEDRGIESYQGRATARRKPHFRLLSLKLKSILAQAGSIQLDCRQSHLTMSRTDSADAPD